MLLLRKKLLTHKGEPFCVLIPLQGLGVSVENRLFFLRSITTLRVLLFFFLLIDVSCKQSVDQEKKPNESVIREKLIEINKDRITEENEQIDAYINRFGYKMNSTETGVRYLILEQGKGSQPKWMSEVKLKYRLDLLDGTYCYSSDSSGIMDIKLGQSTEPSGLQEGILNLKEGSKALLIVPSYLAYGLTGDGNKIAGSQSLVYHVELIETK